MDKTVLIENFSRYAHLYDKYSSIQKMVARELARSIKDNNFLNILEIGCGTGNYTSLLRDRFADARIKAMDISASMIDVAKEKLKERNIEFMIADGEKIKLRERFNLITSSACFQWFNELPSAVEKYREMLYKNGLISFSIFGPKTLYELSTVLKWSLKGADIDSTRFISQDKLKEVLKRDFKSTEIKEFIYEEDYTNLNDLLKKIKYSGTRGNGLSKDIYLGRSLLKKLEDAYLDEFGSIRATYQVFICQGEAL